MPVKLLKTSCQSASDTLVMNGVNKDTFTDYRDYTILKGSMEDFKSDRAGALVGEKMAERYGWKVGDPVSLAELGGVSFNVRGVFTTGGSSDDYAIIAGRQYLQEVDEKPGISNRILVRLKPGIDRDSAIAEINALPLSVKQVTQTEDALLAAMLDQLTDIVMVSRFVILVVVIVMLIAVGNAISMATRERHGEFGLMRTLGFGRFSILSMIIGEGFMQAVFGASLGCLIVLILFSLDIGNAHGFLGVTIPIKGSVKAFGLGIGIVCVAAVIGSFIPAVIVSKLNIVDSLRREE